MKSLTGSQVVLSLVQTRVTSSSLRHVPLPATNPASPASALVFCSRTTRGTSLPRSKAKHLTEKIKIDPTETNRQVAAANKAYINLHFTKLAEVVLEGLGEVLSAAVEKEETTRRSLQAAMWCDATQLDQLTSGFTSWPSRLPGQATGRRPSRF